MSQDQIKNEFMGYYQEINGNFDLHLDQLRVTYFY